MITLDPPPNRVAATIARLCVAATAPLNAFWLCLAGDRNAYAQNLQPLIGDRGMAVLIVREEGFDNPNALMVELVRLLERNRAAFLAALARPRSDPDHVGVVLLARRELGMGQGTSPVTWPEWVPNVGCRETTCYITDITRRVEVPLNAEEIDLGRLGSGLYAVERALLRRLVAVQRRTPTAHQAFFSAIAKRTDAGWLGFLSKAKHEADQVRAVQSYRPSAKTGSSIVCRLWHFHQNRASKEVLAAATALAAALDLPPDEPTEAWWAGLPTVLARWPGKTQPRAERFCRHVIVTIAAAFQYITSAAHSDSYPQYPINLLGSVIDDLYRALVDIEMHLNHLVEDHGENALATGAESGTHDN